MRNCDYGCPAGCRLGQDWLKGQAAMDFRRERPGCKPEACDRHEASRGEEYAA